MTFILGRFGKTAFAPKKIPTAASLACISSSSNIQQHSRFVANLSSKTPSNPTHCDSKSLAWQPGQVSKPGVIDRSQYVPRATFATATAIMKEPAVHEIFEPVTGSWQYVVADPATSTAVIIDPVLDYDPTSGTISTKSADKLRQMVAEMGYRVEMILETHAHADHITAASYLQTVLAKEQNHRPLIGIGSRIKQVQKTFGERYSITAEDCEGVFDRLLEDDEYFEIGTLAVQAIHLPGHTPDHMGYKIGNNIFVGDSIFNADLGSARADFPGGSAEALFQSGRKLLAFPDHTKIWVGHDYPPAGRDAPVPSTTIQLQREQNKHLKDGTVQQDFIQMRQQRDETLAAPRLIHQSLQMNIRAGRLPVPSAAGDRMVHLPLVLPEPAW